MKRTTMQWGWMAAAFFCVAVLFAPRAAAAQSASFNDIGNSYAQQAILRLYQQGIMKGTSATAFSPNKSMTRAELITTLGRLLKLEPATGPIMPFGDVSSGAWYYGWVQTAVQLELASGTSASTFAPQKAVTRQEAAVWLAKFLKQQTGAGNAAGNGSFHDGETIASWAASAVSAVYKLGLIKGDNEGNFRPTDPITRQEAAVLLDRVLQHDGWASELAEKTGERISLGWHYGQTTEQYQKSIQQSNVNTLSPRWYFVDGNGTVSDQTDARLVSWAKANGKQIWAMVGNRSDQDATHQLLSSEKSRNAAAASLAALAKNHGLNGLNLDFENVAPRDRAALTAFVALLSQKLHANRQVLSVDVSPDRDTDWTEAFDYASLGKHADYIVLMGYDQHYGGSPAPGPNASLPYVQEAVRKLLRLVPATKTILALPFYNREWTPKQNEVELSSKFVTLREQNELIKRYSAKPAWDPTLGQYVTGYLVPGYNNGVFPSGNIAQPIQKFLWLEDGRSLSAKYRYAAEQGMAGTAYWYIGGESGDIWASLRNAERFFGYDFLGARITK